jgi:hypothetical protein
VEVEFEMPLRLEGVDGQNLNRVALLHGPIALFAVGSMASGMRRDQLLAAIRVATSAEDWQVRTDAGTFTLRPFASIMSEGYRLYQTVEG